ncbi:hypothetical protein [Chryseolinea lacunae]|uniref:tRNA (Guanine-N1)-methyltransferase n=1 Tax=Chryseolinea lacunae TaxID=2801331 RepID=A0ABS1KPU8_9BACT|nr:hypothetical protein [Chryseolinea lacunae]MBL0741252.1 hypothetical protein [Chryseolinea lacunae]
MKTSLVLCACLLACSLSFAQTATEAVQGAHTLRERFLLMKSKSQSYGDYKVIKEFVLDGVWKIVTDSLTAKDAAIRAGQANVNGLKAELSKTVAALNAKEKSMEDVMYASTHITVLGIDFNKGVFLTVVASILGGLIAFVAIVFGRMKLQSKSLSERNLAVSALTNEFEEYKHRAMDKQTKLSRELQDERNKLASMRHS